MTDKAKQYHPANTFWVAGVVSPPGEQNPALTSVIVIAENRQEAVRIANSQIEGFSLVSVSSHEEIERVNALLAQAARGEDVPLQVFIEEGLPDY